VRREEREEMVLKNNQLNRRCGPDCFFIFGVRISFDDNDVLVPINIVVSCGSVMMMPLDCAQLIFIFCPRFANDKRGRKLGQHHSPVRSRVTRRKEGM